MNAPRDRRVGAYDVVVIAAASGYVADKVLLSSEVEGRPIAHDQPQRQECLRRDAILIRPLVGGARKGADAGLANAKESCSLQCQRIGKSPLAGRAERECCTRQTKNLRRHVAVTAVQTPYTAIVVADVVSGSQQKSAGRNALETNRSRCR